MKTIQLTILALITFAGGVLHAAPFATDFTYQGRLTDAGQPANGYFEFEYSLWTAPVTGTRLETFGSDIDVTNGLFTIEMEFDPNFINGDNLWLEIKTRRFGVTNYTTLTPRQRLAPAPYAITAKKLSGTLPAAQLPASVVTNNATGLTLSGTFSGNGANVTNVNAASLGGLSAGQFWKIGRAHV